LIFKSYSELVNHESYGIKADCWAFGCILYAMATGNPPFEVSYRSSLFLSSLGRICQRNIIECQERRIPNA